MTGCLKNEFIKLKNKLLPFAVLVIVISGITASHLCMDVRTLWTIYSSYFEGEDAMTWTPEKIIESTEKSISEYRKTAEKQRKQKDLDGAEAAEKAADREEKELLSYYKDLLEKGFATVGWQYDCVESRYIALGRGEDPTVIEGFDRALKENDCRAYLQAKCDTLKDSVDGVDLTDYYEYSFLLETGANPDNKANRSRASKYASNLFRIQLSKTADEADKLNAENESLKEATRRNAGDPDRNAAFYYIRSHDLHDIQFALMGIIGVFAAAAVFGVDRKRKKTPAVYLLPVSRTKTNAAKLLTALMLSIGGLILYSVIILVTVLFFSEGSMFETVYVVAFGKTVFCTPFTVLVLYTLASIPVLALVISFMFFAVAITKNTPVSVVLGIALSVSFFAFRVVELNHPGSRYWLRNSIFSVSDWAHFIAADSVETGQSFLWSAVSLTLHLAFFISLGLLLENHSED